VWVYCIVFSCKLGHGEGYVYINPFCIRTFSGSLPAFGFGAIISLGIRSGTYICCMSSAKRRSSARGWWEEIDNATMAVRNEQKSYRLHQTTSYRLVSRRMTRMTRNKYIGTSIAPGLIYHAHILAWAFLFLWVVRASVSSAEPVVAHSLVGRTVYSVTAMQFYLSPDKRGEGGPWAPRAIQGKCAATRT